MKKMLKILALAAATVSISTDTKAAEEFALGGLRPECFTQAAVAMTPYDDSVQNALVHMTHERVYHNDGTTGTILLYGHVHPWIEQWGDGVRFWVTYRDPDGPGSASQVQAELRFIGPQGIQILRTLNSNDSAAVTNETQKMSTTMGWSVLKQTYGYYVVRIYVTRTNTAVTPAAFGYSLCSAIF